jgi:hypothetical protein
LLELSAITAILLVARCYFGGRWRLGGRNSAQPNGEPQPGGSSVAPAKPADSSADGKKYAPLSVSFSVFLLIWVLVLVAYQPSESTGKCPAAVPCKQPPASATSKFEVKPLNTIPLFDPGISDRYFFPGSDNHKGLQGKSALPQLEAVFSGTQEGDTLLLLGSADCTSFQKGGNAGLAQGRATTIMKELQANAEKRGVDIEPTALKQHSACKDTQEMRAVFPVLIHPASVGH